MKVIATIKTCRAKVGGGRRNKTHSWKHTVHIISHLINYIRYVPYSGMTMHSLQHYDYMFPTALWSYVPYSTMVICSLYSTMVICSLQYYGHMFPTALWSYVPYSTMVIPDVHKRTQSIKCYSPSKALRSFVDTRYVPYSTVVICSQQYLAQKIFPQLLQ